MRTDINFYKSGIL